MVARPLGIVVGYTHVFSPNFLSEYRTGYSRLNNTGINFNQGSKFMDEIGIPGIDGYGYQWQAVGVFNITGVDQVGGTGNIPFVKATNNYQYSFHVTWLHDKHSLKWGYDLLRRGMNTVQMQAPSGNFTFTGQFTERPTASNKTKRRVMRRCSVERRRSLHPCPYPVLLMTEGP